MMNGLNSNLYAFAVLTNFVIFLALVKPTTGRNSNSSVPTNHTITPQKSDKTRIIGGVETARYEFPFIVSFARHGRHFCGGSIIDSEWVLTAAHCASEADFTVTAGEHNLDTNEGTEQKSKAVKVIRHPSYNPITYEDDICLIKINPPFSYDKNVKPFAVPNTHYVASGNATVAGWGTEDEAYQVVSPVLRKVTVPLVQSIDCAYQYGSYFHPHKMICAGEEEGGKDACQGDSGGPLMCNDYHKGATLCGVVSFGVGCARPELAGVYTKVAHYSDWIDFEIKKNTDSDVVPPRTRKTTPHNRFHDTIPITAPPYNPPSHNVPTIPPGYVVIIKPVSPNNGTYGNGHSHNHNHDHYPRHTPPPARYRPDRKSGESRVNLSISSLVLVLVCSLVMLST